MSARAKKAKMANRNVGQQAARPKDDGRRFVVQRDGRQVYPGAGVPLAEAQQLAGGLVIPASVVEVPGA